MSRTKMLPLGLLLVAVSLSVGCSGIQTRWDFDPEADFASLETWAWLPHEHENGDPRIDNTLVDTRVRSAVESALAARGYRKVQSDPSFGVVYHAAINSKLQADTITQYHGYGYGYGYRGYRGGWGGPAYSETVISEYEVGSIIVDVLTPAGDKLLWRGIAEAEIDERANPEKRTERVNLAMEKLFENFPPAP